MSETLVTKFTTHQQELVTVIKRRSSGAIIETDVLSKYSFELMNYHLFSIDKIVSHFNSDLEFGLKEKTVQRLISEQGRNVVPPPPELPMWAKFLLSFVSGFAPLLWIATGLVFISWEPFGTPPSNLYNLILAIVLILVICVSSIVSFYQEVVSSRVLGAFKNLIPSTCVVIRDGQATSLAAADLVVGDIVLLTTGMKVPADMRIATATGLKVDKSMLTGESEPATIDVNKGPEEVSLLDAKNVVFMGTNIVEGDGKGIVIATGVNNQLAKIVAKVSGSKTSSLQQDINRLFAIIGSFAVITGVLVVLWWAFDLRVKHNGFMNISTLIGNAISVVVAYVPEGLPLALSMGLTIIAQRLCGVHKVLVKQLSTIETLGSMSFLGSDKTGTLTMNKMHVTSLINASSITTIISPADEKELTKGYATLAFNSYLVAALCNQAKVEEDRNAAIVVNNKLLEEQQLQQKMMAGRKQQQTIAADVEEGNEEQTDYLTGSKHHQSGRRYVAVGSNATDRALLNWVLHHEPAASSATTSATSAAVTEPEQAALLEEDKKDVEMHLYHHILKDYEVLIQLPFNSNLKLAATVVKHLQTGDVFVYVKGAPERILAQSTFYFNARGDVVPMQAAFMNSIASLINAEGSLGRRMVGLAMIGPLSLRGFSPNHCYSIDPSPNFPVDDCLTFLSCVAISDPLKPGVREAITSLRTAGILVAMITGDAANTAEAIAREVNIISSPSVEEQTADEEAATGGRDKPAALVAGGGNKVDTLAEYLIQQANKTASVTLPTVHQNKAIIVTGKDLEAIDEQGWDYIFASYHTEFVFARTSPEQKLLIVKEMQKRGHRVGVTGDGVNDSPALKNADVGIAMNSGSDVARDAAAMVLLEDDFTAIVQGVKEGRLIFENLRKVIGYQISAGCWAELLPVLATFFLGMPTPLNSFCMIVISCVSDVFAGVALMNEPAEDAIMLRPPRDVKARPLFDMKLVFYGYIFYANLASIGCFVNYFLYMSGRGPTREIEGPIPADDDGQRSFPIGYRPSQLIGAWNWGLDTSSSSGSSHTPTGDLGADEALAAAVGSSIFYVTILVTQMGHLLSIRRKTPYFYDAIMNTGASTAAPAGATAVAAANKQRGGGYTTTGAMEIEAVDGNAATGLAVVVASNKHVLLRILEELISNFSPRNMPWAIVLAWIGAILAANFFISTPVFVSYCGTSPIPGKYWGYAIGWSMCWFTMAEMRKWLIILYPQSWMAKLDF